MHETNSVRSRYHTNLSATGSSSGSIDNYLDNYLDLCWVFHVIVAVFDKILSKLAFARFWHATLDENEEWGTIVT